MVAACLLAGCGPSFTEPPLVQAALDGDLKRLDRLLANGADPNRHTKPGWGTAVAAAASRPDNSAVLRRLVAAGADADGLANPGCMGCCPESALSVAVDAENTRALMESGADLRPAPPACEVVPSGTPEKIRLLLKAGISPNAQRTFPGAVPPAFQVGTDALKVLLEAGADPTVLDFWGNSAIAWSAGGRDLERLLLLRAAGARLTTNVFGQNALHLACRSIPYPNVVETLLSWGVDPNVRDQYGYTPARYLRQTLAERQRGVLGSFLDSFFDPAQREAQARLREVIQLLASRTPRP